MIKKLMLGFILLLTSTYINTNATGQDYIVKTTDQLSVNEVAKIAQTKPSQVNQIDDTTFVVKGVINEGKVEFNPKIDNVIKDFPITISSIQDPLFSNQTNLQYLNKVVIDKSYNSSNKTIVAIIDTGLDIMHPDLQGQIFINTKEIPNNNIDDDKNGYIDDVNGWNTFDGNNNVFDLNGHGTHVAGIIGAKSNNIGIVGLAKNVAILPIKAFNEFGYSSLSIINSSFAYIQTLINQGYNIKIVNGSWGFEANPDYLGEDIKYISSFILPNYLFLSAAGNFDPRINNNQNTKMYPAALDNSNIISVGSVDFDKYSNFSFYGSWIDVASYGNNVLSTMAINSTISLNKEYCDNTLYCYLSGTSMATPFVSAQAALLLSKLPNLSVEQLKQLILSNVTTKDYLIDKVSTKGIINPYQALQTITCKDNSLPISTKQTNGLSYVYGNNNCGQLGNGSNQSLTQDNAFQIPIANIKKVVTTPTNVYVLTNDQKLYATGGNQHGQLANFSRFDQNQYKQMTLPGVYPIDISIDNGYRLVVKTNLANVTLYVGAKSPQLNSLSLLGDQSYFVRQLKTATTLENRYYYNATKIKQKLSKVIQDKDHYYTQTTKYDLTRMIDQTTKYYYLNKLNKLVYKTPTKQTTTTYSGIKKTIDVYNYSNSIKLNRKISYYTSNTLTSVTYYDYNSLGQLKTINKDYATKTVTYYQNNKVNKVIKYYYDKSGVLKRA